MEWLLASVDPSRDHEVDLAVAWHARTMVLAWAVLFPVGILVARFMKIWPGQKWPDELDNKRWWRIHLVTQGGGGVLVLIGLALVWFAPQGTAAGTWHQVFGWTTVAVCGLQILSGLLRGTKGGPTAPAADGSLRGDHFDMTLRRRLFEYWHKAAGYGALALAALAILTGLWIANAPNWMWLSIIGWWLLLSLAAYRLQRAGRCVDTYQAIWGNAPNLPGNRRRPIGIGIRRP